VKHIELLWFDGCPHYRAARQLIDEVVSDSGADAVVEMVEVPDEATGQRLGFPGSPTIRVDGQDIDPTFEPCADCTPRCRVYAVEGRLMGLPDRRWIEAAIMSGHTS
jgi:hypothetical protein